MSMDQNESGNGPAKLSAVLFGILAVLQTTHFFDIRI